MTYSSNRDPLLDQVAAFLKQRGLHSAALTLLEAGQPLAFIGSQLLWLTQPTAALLGPTTRLRQMAELLEDPQAVRGLMDRLATDEAAP
jgi:hypothetical protein